MYRLLLVIFFLSLRFTVFSQGENNRWYFGTGTGLDFNTNPPTQIFQTNTSWIINEAGCISDSAGKFLFLCDGWRLYDKNIGITFNGFNLIGNPNYAQNTVLINTPGNYYDFYLFNVRHDFPTAVGLYYSHIDLHLNGGLGDIISGEKNLPVPGGNTVSENIIPIRHHNNRDIWIIAFDSNMRYLSYKIDQYGINTTPVISQSALPQYQVWLFARNDVMKISPDGNKLVKIRQVDSLAEFCRFNDQTGVVTPLFRFRPTDTTLNVFQIRSAEFSVKGKYLYVNAVFMHPPNVTPYDYRLFQYDATLEDSAQFMQSQTFIAYDSSGFKMQIAADGKIYQAKNQMDYLNIINNPDGPGTACNFVNNAYWLHGRPSHEGLPPFLQSYKAYIIQTGECTNQAVHLTGDIWPPADTVRWNFGDPASGAANISFQTDGSHIYANPGTYTVELYVRHNDNRTDTSHKTITIKASPQPNAGPDKSLCSGDSATFDAGPCTGCTFEWKNLTLNTITGTSQTYTATTAGLYSVTVVNPDGCTGTDSVSLALSLPPQITNQSFSKSICSGESTNIALTSDVTTTTYSWTASLVSGTVSGFSADSGILIDQILTNNSLAAGVVTYHVTPKNGSCTGNPADFTVTVNPGDSINISVAASQNNICEGNAVNFTATPTGSGILNYQWQVNGINQGTDSPTFTYVPQNNDLVKCILSSPLTVCIQNNPAVSNEILMHVNQNITLSLTVSASNNNICGNIPVTFTATGNPPSGWTPVYQWTVNGVNSGSGLSTFTYTPSNNDLVSCTMAIPGLPCSSNNPAPGNQILMVISPAPVVTFTSCIDSVTTSDAKPFKLKGGLPLGGTYSGPGVNSSTGIFTPSLAGTGAKAITYSYTNSGMCSGTKVRNILVKPAAAFLCGNVLTDVRDNSTYRTMKAGNQCWFAENLKFGNPIPQTQHQRDNCIAERYCSTANCQLPIAYLFQWDELMNYTDAGDQKGLCPPAWHVPSETEWQQLFSNWTNSAFAASALKSSGFSGFNTLLSGSSYHTSQYRYPGFSTFFWTSDPDGSYKAWAHGMNQEDPSVSSYPSGRQNGFAVRCVKD